MIQKVYLEEMEGFMIERVTRDEEYSMQYRHFHDGYELYFLMEGERYYFIDKETYRVEKGMMVEREIPLPDIDHSAPIVAIRVPELSPAELLLWEYLIAHFSDGL